MYDERCLLVGLTCIFANSTLVFRSQLHHCGHFTLHNTFMVLPMKSDVDPPTKGYRERKDRIK